MKNLIIVGASGSIGKAIYHDLSKYSNYNFILTANNGYNELLKDANFKNAKIKKLDLIDKLSQDKFINDIDREYKTIDAIIFASGISEINMLNKQEDLQIKKILDINLYAPIIITKKLMGKLLALKDIRTTNIIYISSIWGMTGASCEAVYSASKAGLINFSNALAKELGPSGVRVNSISPGLIDTKMNDAISKNDKDIFIEEIPLRRVGYVDEVAKTVRFLLDVNYVTGANIKIDGGLL